jgi:cytochrome c biogenesis protein CcdA
MTELWHVYYLMGVASGFIVAAFFIRKLILRYRHAPKWSKREELTNIISLIFVNLFLWPVLGFLIMAFLFILIESKPA